MAKDAATKDAFARFVNQYQECIIRLGNGKAGVEADKLRLLVRDERVGAGEFVDLHIKIAATNGGYLQPALIVAGAIAVEYEDRSYIERVKTRARQLSIGDPEQTLSFARDLEGARTPPPEKQAATRWWDEHPPDHRAICDNCSTPLGRGDGFIVSDRMLQIEEATFSLGDELLCQKCYQTYKSGTY